jgi:hypothetical protein
MLQILITIPLQRGNESIFKYNFFGWSISDLKFLSMHPGKLYNILYKTIMCNILRATGKCAERK